MAKDSNGKDRELKKRIESDDYMSCAVRECYASFRNVLMFLVGGDREKEYVFSIIPHNIFFDAPRLSPILVICSLLVPGLLNIYFAKLTSTLKQVIF